jgi:hypothetical protein
MHRWPDVEAAVLAVIDRGLHLDAERRTGRHIQSAPGRSEAGLAGAASAKRAERYGQRRGNGSR